MEIKFEQMANSFIRDRESSISKTYRAMSLYLRLVRRDTNPIDELFWSNIKCRVLAHIEEVDRIYEEINLITREFKILMEIRNKRGRKNKRRKIFSVYRLYKKNLLTPIEISLLLGVREITIKNWIGRVFKESCLKEKCWAKPFLEN